MNLTPQENAFIDQLAELNRIENALCCAEAQAVRLIQSAARISEGTATGRTIQNRKQTEARAAFLQLLVTTPSTRFATLLEELS